MTLIVVFALDGAARPTSATRTRPRRPSTRSDTEYVAARVAPHKRIRKLQFTDSIPKSPSGKILRRTLIEEERAKAAAGEAGASATASASA